MLEQGNQQKGKAMEQQVSKGVRLPKDLIQRIERIAEKEGSTFSQFMRTAAIKELSRKAN